MKKIMFLITLITFNIKSNAQICDYISDESKFSYLIHKNFNFSCFYSDTSFKEKAAYINIVFKYNIHFKVDTLVLEGKYNDKMKTEIEKSIFKSINKTYCDSLDLKPNTYYSFPLIFRVGQVSSSYRRLKEKDKSIQLCVNFKDIFYEDLISSFDEFKKTKKMFDKPVILLPIVDLENPRNY